MRKPLRPLPKFILIAGIIGSLGYGAYRAGLIKTAPPQPAISPAPVTLPSVAPIAPAPAVTPLPVSMPNSPAPARTSGSLPCIRYEVWAWNAQFGLMYANGGPVTTPNSIMAKHGVCVQLTRQDDTSQMQNDLVTFAKELAGGNPQPSAGAHFVTIMGDGSAQFFAALEVLKKLCPECIVQMIGAAGYSVGEDKFMGQAAWLTSPAAAQGSLIAGVLRDGDWNIALKWAGDNKLCNNPDEKTYMPECLNWLNAESYTAAAEMYVANYCEDRPVVKAGRYTGENKHLCVNGVVTWTPGDVTIAKKRGGLVNIVSTKENRWQMPAVIIGNKRWMTANRHLVEEMLAAIFEGGAAVKADPVAMQQAAVVSTQVYKEETPDYWLTYYKGTTETDATGVPIELGGSTVNTLADNLQMLGLLEGGDNLLGIVYKNFGDLVVQQYPRLVPNYPPLSQVLDMSYVQALQARNTQAAAAAPDLPTYNAYQPITKVESRREWHIAFETGKATLLPEGLQTLQQIYEQAAVTRLAIEVHGHTDNTGLKARNQALSEARALAVTQWLQRKSSVNFPSSRLKALGHGADYPVAPNDTEPGRAANRRVEIIMGS